MSSLPTAAALREAIQIHEKIDALQSRLTQILGGKSITPSTAPAKRGRKRGSKMSAAGRARIVAAQKARWAKVKGKSVKAAPKSKPGKKKGGLTPEGRAKIVAALKARWAAKRKAAGK